MAAKAARGVGCERSRSTDALACRFSRQHRIRLLVDKRCLLETTPEFGQRVLGNAKFGMRRGEAR
jgi:hypothetical protein